MNRMLFQDFDKLQIEFGRAANFISAAHLRYECYGLLVSSTRTSHQITRLRELLQAPACREPWFIDVIKNNVKFAPSKYYIVDSNNTTINLNPYNREKDSWNDCGPGKTTFSGKWINSTDKIRKFDLV